MKRRTLSWLLVFALVLGMLPVSAAAAEVPFTVQVGGSEITDITESTLTWTSWDGTVSDVTCYTVAVPEDAQEATLVFPQDMNWTYYTSTGEYIGEGATSWTGGTEHTVAIQDANSDSEPDGISVQTPGKYSADYFILFQPKTAEPDPTEPETTEPTVTEPTVTEPTVTEPQRPFLSIRANGTVLPESAIVFRTLFDMGDLEASDGYAYVHEDIPYYHVTVPCGVTSVEVTYGADVPIMNYGSDAYGYATDLQVDAVSSATVKGRTFKGGYTLNSDGTQTLVTPVTGYTFDESGYGWAITPESGNDPYPAICLMTFGYDGVTHVYTETVTPAGCEEPGVRTFTCTCGDSYTQPIEATGHSFSEGTCSVCGAPDPDFEGEIHTHSYESAVTTQPTCEGEGVTTFTCSCGDSYTQPIPATGHSYESAVTAQPTCEGEGVTTFTCACGDSYTQPIPATGHSYDEGTVTAQPTCEGEGVKLFACTVCQSTTTEAIAATGHSFSEGSCTVCGAQDPTPSQDEAGVYQLGTAEQLVWFAEAVNGGNSSISGTLTEDIDLTAVDWPGIGSSSYPFAGSFDGQGHTVTLSGTWGLFNRTKGSSGSYVTIANVVTAGSVSTSGVVHIAIYTRVENCVNRADITGDSYIAGIVGSVNKNNFKGESGAVITGCRNEGTVTGNNYVGGILGYTQTGTQVTLCHNAGDISGSNAVGGIAGYMQRWTGTTLISDSYNTGSVSGSGYVAGILGQTYNGVSVSNVYNAGQAPYGITAAIYNGTASFSNTYYQGTKSTKALPDNSYGFSSVSVTALELSSPEFAATLGENFLASCPGPVLSWQTPSDHTGTDDGVCDVCGLGGDVKEVYTVTIPSGTGYLVEGEATAIQGESYSFTVSIDSAYEKSESFQVQVNGQTVSGTGDVYTLEEVTGPISITVTGVTKIPDSYTVTVPAAGSGYRVNLEGEPTVARDGSYRFTVSTMEGFRKTGTFEVQVNGVTVTAGSDGLYTVTAVRSEQVITVSGVEAIPGMATATVTLTITYGENQFYTADATGGILLDQAITVPYFDLSTYGLERYYYNPYCYVDESGNPTGRQEVGTPETAYNVVTTMHAFICATEIFYLGLDPEDAGQGISYRTDTDKDGVSDFEEAVSWSQGAGSSFMDLWDHGTNLNYYLNYIYPLAFEGWGSTSDQEALSDGDVLSIHLIQSNSVSGSNFAVITAEDEDKVFSQTDTKDRVTVTQGQVVSLTLYQTSNTGKYDTKYDLVSGQELYWIEKSNVTADVRDWNRTAFGAMAAGSMVTDSSGTVSINTAGLEPGVYYIGARGGLTAGGSADNAGFVSRGGETGAVFFELTVLEAPETPGDANSDGTINALDVTILYNSLRSSSSVAISVADVNGDGTFNALDVTALYNQLRFS